MLVSSFNGRKEGRKEGIGTFNETPADLSKSKISCGRRDRDRRVRFQPTLLTRDPTGYLDRPREAATRPPRTHGRV
jgi:hypothetical protein